MCALPSTASGGSVSLCSSRSAVRFDYYVAVFAHTHAPLQWVITTLDVTNENIQEIVKRRKEKMCAKIKTRIEIELKCVLKMVHEIWKEKRQQESRREKDANLSLPECGRHDEGRVPRRLRFSSKLTSCYQTRENDTRNDIQGEKARKQRGI